MSGWHSMPVTQRLLGLPSPCSECQMPSPPSSVCLPSSNLLLTRREAALFAEDFLSERMLVPSLLGCFSASLLCCSFCPSLPLCLSPLSANPSPLGDFHPLTQIVILHSSRCAIRGSFRSSPRIRSAPQSRFFAAISLIKAMVSADTLA
jgi:hypothetical protein